MDKMLEFFDNINPSEAKWNPQAELDEAESYLSDLWSLVEYEVQDFDEYSVGKVRELLGDIERQMQKIDTLTEAVDMEAEYRAERMCRRGEFV